MGHFTVRCMNCLDSLLSISPNTSLTKLSATIQNLKSRCSGNSMSLRLWSMLVQSHYMTLTVCTNFSSSCFTMSFHITSSLPKICMKLWIESITYSLSSMLTTRIMTNKLRFSRRLQSFYIRKRKSKQEHHRNSCLFCLQMMKKLKTNLKNTTWKFMSWSSYQHGSWLSDMKNK